MHGDDIEVQPGWPGSADQLSILLEEKEQLDDGRSRCLVGFLVPDLARPYLYPGSKLLVMEVSRAVASAWLEAVFGHYE